MVLQGCFKKFLRVFQDTFNGVSRKIKGCFKGVFSGESGKKFKRYIRGVLKLFLGGFMEVLRVFQESFYGASKNFQWCLKKVLSGFQVGFMGV